MESATSPAPSRATALTSCSTPNPSMVERSTESLQRSCKSHVVISHYLRIAESLLFNTQDDIWVWFRPCSSPNDKKSFCSIEGEWNGVMYAKWATGVSPLFYLRYKM